MKRAERQDRKRREAEARNAAWAKLTPEEQLQSLDDRGHIAKKQRMKINANQNC